MKLLDPDHAIPMMKMMRTGPHTMRRFEDQLLDRKIIWGADPVTFQSKSVPSIMAVDVMLQILRAYFAKRHGAAWWHPSKSIGSVLVDILHTTMFPNVEFLAVCRMDHILGALKEFSINYSCDGTQLPEAYESAQIPAGSTWLGILGRPDPHQPNMGTIFLSLQIARVDLDPWELSFTANHEEGE